MKHATLSQDQGNGRTYTVHSVEQHYWYHMTAVLAPVEADPEAAGCYIQDSPRTFESSVAAGPKSHGAPVEHPARTLEPLVAAAP